MKKIITGISIIILFSALAIIRFSQSIYAAVLPIGNYIELKGGYLKADSSTISSPSAFSFEAWVKPDSLTGVQKILSIGDKTAGNLRYEIGLNGSAIFLKYRYDNNSSQTSITAGGIPADVWSHIAVTVSSSLTKIYINGKAVPFNITGITNLAPIGGNIILGNSYQEPLTNAEAFKGAIDEMQISNSVRDITGLWGSGAYDNPLVADYNTIVLWHFDEARGAAIAFDSSVNHLDGVLIGGDSLIHFYGVSPSPTPMPSLTLPSLRWSRPVLPTLRILLPPVAAPTDIPAPTSIIPTTSISDIRQFPRTSRSFTR